MKVERGVTVNNMQFYVVIQSGDVQSHSAMSDRPEAFRQILDQAVEDSVAPLLRELDLKEKKA